MKAKKTLFHFFTIADFREEEAWLRKQQNKGWRLTGLTGGCIYHFDVCEPEDVIYRLSYGSKQDAENAEFIQMAADFGWEYCLKHDRWLYFRKRAVEAGSENDGELFSDNASRISMLQDIIKTSLLPIIGLFLCAILPNVTTVMNRHFSIVFSVFMGILFCLYVFLIACCGLKLRRMKKELEK